MVRFNNEDDLPNVSYSVGKGTFSKSSQKRDYILITDELSVINCDKFFDKEIYEEQVMMAIERICINIDERNDFISLLKNNQRTEYYVIYDAIIFTNNIDLWRLYMYGLCYYVNLGHKITYNSDLNTSPSMFYSAMSYNINTKYEQYIDVYDVMNELNHSSDVLTEFMKMYQILEYLIYRSELIKVVNGASIKQSFVRQVKGIDRKYLNSERSAFVDKLFTILSSFHGELVNADITTDIVNYCTKYYELNKDGRSYINTSLCNHEASLNKAIAKFIYDTRCAIVHNKEAEFHITYLNYEEYSCIIPFMRKIIVGVKKRIVELLNKDNNLIEFSSDHIDLY